MHNLQGAGSDILILRHHRWKIVASWPKISPTSETNPQLINQRGMMPQDFLDHNPNCMNLNTIAVNG
jgi:hypothetical protein